MLSGSKILLAVTGGIAAYKSAIIVRLLQKEGAEVKVVMTPAAKDFVTPLTLAALSGHEVYTELIEEEKGGYKWNNHVHLSEWADILLVAPATANTLTKMAQGLCDNIVTACFLSFRGDTFVAPAMDLEMYKHPSTQQNFSALKSQGVHLIDSREGFLASGLHGKGRMAEPEEILEELNAILGADKPLKGQKVLISAGPTRVYLDPVRFISNPSTGTMGYMLAEEAALLGAEVQLISGPVHLKLNHPNVHITNVETVDEMSEEMYKNFEESTIVISAAAVGDYQPRVRQSEKIKKSGDSLNLELVKTKDILFELGKIKKNQLLIGFALETENEFDNASKKLVKKNLDAIVLNSLKVEGAGFGNTTNKVEFVTANAVKKSIPLKDKRDVAKDIWTEILKIKNEK
ncbi:MAG: bifunctional phosphopantothenoylcysteine decarboxylase/phosphopantothenate--cysteine ligase CoaBC [Flavobacteriaceae bacterium]